MGGLVLVEERLGLLKVSEVGILGGDKDPGLVISLVLRHGVLDPVAHEACAAGYKDHLSSRLRYALAA